MTSPNVRPHPSRRQQLVTALLIGAVVIVLGVASGIGIDTHASGAQGPATAPPATVTVTPSVAPSRVPMHYVGVAAPPVGGVGVPIVPSVSSPTGAATAPSAAAGSTTASATPSTHTSPRVDAEPPVTCSSGLLGGLLDALLGVGAPTGSGGLLDLVGGLLGGLTQPATTASTGGLGGLFDLLAPSPSTTTATTGSTQNLLSVVTSLLPGVLSQQGAATSASPALASACTSSVASSLPLIAGLR